MSRNLQRTLGVAIAFLLACGTARADPPPPPTAVDILALLFLCGLMGLVGQGCRVIVGMVTLTTYKLTAPPTNQDVFNLARLLFSLVVGFLAGIAAALTQWGASGLDSIHVTDFATVIKFGIAGYLGADFIEGFTSRFFDKSAPLVIGATTPASAAPLAPPTQSSEDLGGTLSDIHAMVAAVAEKAGDTTSPMAKFKEKAPGIMSQLMDDFGVNDFQAAGILGNIGVECDGFTEMQEINPVGGGTGGYGWAQWTGPRRKQFFAYCQKTGNDKDSDAANYGFMKQEFEGPYKSVIVNLKKTQTVADATRVVLVQYEGAGVPATDRRIAWANMALTAFKSQSA
jgi:Phage tail lysozyme